MVLKIKNVLLFVCFSFLISCNPDCKQVKVNKVEWKTHYKNYYVDTLVNYEIVDEITMIEKSNSTTERDNHIHSVIIKNNNLLYSNYFAVEFQCCSYYDNYKSWTHSTEYVIIPPNSEHMFSYKWSGARGNFNSDNSVIVSILQKPKRVLLQRRIDELITSVETVDNCSCDVDALQAKYDAIKLLYEKLKKEGLIRAK